MGTSIPVLIVKRVGLGLLLLLAVSILIFAGTQILPGDVAQSILGQSATPQALANLRAELGLNDPAWLRYLHWLGGLLTGDLGTALTSRQDIASSLWPRLKNTLFLAFWAAAISVPLAIALGLIAVRYRNGFVDKAISAFALASTSFPFVTRHAALECLARIWSTVILLHSEVDNRCVGFQQRVDRLVGTSSTSVCFHMAGAKFGSFFISSGFWQTF